MSIQYDFYQNPPKKGSKRAPKLHARVKPISTMTTNQLAKFINDTTTISTADFKGAFEAAINTMTMALTFGQNVHIEGLGLFYLTATCEQVETPNERRAESVRIKTVHFRPDASLVKRFKAVHLERVREKNHSLDYSEIEIDHLLTGHFMDNDYIKRKQFCRLCGLTLSTGMRRLRQLIADGKLRHSSLSKSLYEPVPGNYRRPLPTEPS